MSLATALREKLKRYQYRDLVVKDCVPALETFKNLSPLLDNYSDERGQVSQLLALTGTIPVNYNGNTYNIPICAWIRERHPYSCPFVYVKPTSSMMIKEGKHVNKAGRVFCPYLHEWTYPGHDLVTLLSLLCMIFSEEMPVFSTNSPHPPYPNYPGGQPRNMPYGGYGPSGMSVPNSSQGFQMPMPFGGGGMAGYSSPSSGGGMPTPYPSAIGPVHSSYQGSSQPPYGGGRSGSQPPYPALSSSSQPPYSMGSSSSQPSPYPSTYGQTATQSYSGATPGYTPYPVSRGTTNSYSSAVTQSSNERQSSIEENDIRRSLLSAVEEKLTRRVKGVYELAKGEIETLSSKKAKLESGSKQLADLQEKITEQTITIENSNQILEQKNQELKEMVEKLTKNTETMNIDEAIVTTAPLYNQIFELFAEENATEDAIYFLGEALRREVIELEVFLKAVRKLSRKMFMQRALLQKARQAAGLA